MHKRLLPSAILLGLISGVTGLGQANAASSAPMVAPEPAVYSFEQALLSALSGADDYWRMPAPWESAMRRYLAPESLARLLPGHPVATGWTASSVRRALSFEWESDSPLGVRWQQSSLERGVFGRSTGHVGGPSGMAGLDAGMTLRQDFISPTLFGDFGDRLDWTVSAVFAYQEITPLSVFHSVNPAREFFSPDNQVPRAGSRATDSATGAGVRFGMAFAPLDSLELQASYRSRISMGEFASFRGVFLQPGQLDLPAVASAEMTWRPSNSTRLRAQAQQVMFSDVEPFISAQLPLRVLSVLGDVDSPEFAWRDLTVLGVGASWQVASNWRADVDYSTSYQPRPTSMLLDRLLSEESPDENLRLAVVRAFGNDMSLDFSARYNGDFILGLPIYMQREAERTNTVEFQAALAWSF